VAEAPPMHVRPPAATELAESLDMGLLVVVGPEPVEGPFVIGPLVRAAEQWPPSHSPAFTWLGVLVGAEPSKRPD